MGDISTVPQTCVEPLSLQPSQEFRHTYLLRPCETKLKLKLCRNNLSLGLRVLGLMGFKA